MQTFRGKQALTIEVAPLYYGTQVLGIASPSNDCQQIYA